MAHREKTSDSRPEPTQERESADKAERRRYFRIDDRLVLKYRPVAPGEAESLVARLEYEYPTRHQIANTFSNTSQQMQYLLHKIQDTNPDVAHCLSSLNQKLDMLARQLSLEASEMENEPVRHVNISASGVCFEAETAASPGSLVELKLLLLPSCIRISAVGKVIRCDDNTADEPGLPFRIAVYFEYLPEADRELLVQHVVKRESLLLRDRRGDEPDI